MHILRLLLPLLAAALVTEGAAIRNKPQPADLPLVFNELNPLRQRPGCDISTKQLPKIGHPPELPGPEASLQLKYVTFGVGTQNYTCAGGVTKPVHIGAVATLYDGSCLVNMNFRIMDILSYISLHTSNASAKWVLEDFLKLPKLGQHYFTGGRPFFDLTTRGGSDKAYVSVVANVPAPSNSDVSWLRLNKVEGSGMEVVFRVETQEGTSPATCDGKVSDFQVGYTAQYWVYG
ncbi:hypothetical protein MGYG_06149 [Nannizzia gypsea CBS 118893]|uniref:Malate dehydrogenase n=1 Tax=Arthroderma gypseum (strain ATCC MYA-4604 / CBS 118893) TaxID=535722 RepID=E4V0L7_ARTGP|nr:hypothetical protein MGYG_06149 [Nannizzia gypsea CBS 118893]EFR03154.1 hypothetical protein MGYG_06149 [Nannizzia gypsea CBS 118893]